MVRVKSGLTADTDCELGLTVDISRFAILALGYEQAVP